MGCLAFAVVVVVVVVVGVSSSLFVVRCRLSYSMAALLHSHFEGPLYSSSVRFRGIVGAKYRLTYVRGLEMSG